MHCTFNDWCLSFGARRGGRDGTFCGVPRHHTARRRRSGELLSPPSTTTHAHQYNTLNVRGQPPEARHHRADWQGTAEHGKEFSDRRIARQGEAIESWATTSRCAPRWATSSTCREGPGRGYPQGLRAAKYVVIEKKDRLLKELKNASKKAETVYLAPDPDREGEFIAWSLKKMLGLRKPRRAVFNEITKRAVQDAIAHTREIDENLFNAQQARRVLDRLVGYKISPLLWRRVQSGTSAGRVQSVALRLICASARPRFAPSCPKNTGPSPRRWPSSARSRPSRRHSSAARVRRGRRRRADRRRWRAETRHRAKKCQGRQIRAGEERRASASTSEDEAKAVLAELEGATYTVLTVRQRDVRRQPFLPYTTSTLQQDASVRLRFKPKRTMSLAQQLYEGIELGDAGHQGLITYMRTDSTRVSAEAQTAVKEYIAQRSPRSTSARAAPPRPRRACRTPTRRSAPRMSADARGRQLVSLRRPVQALSTDLAPLRGLVHGARRLRHRARRHRRHDFSSAPLAPRSSSPASIASGRVRTMATRCRRSSRASSLICARFSPDSTSRSRRRASPRPA